ncbi:MAG: hypothetical protein GF417_00445 [Candidatus Latescibacteria bacterium]|nr:hypothetical protein [bacterium]MBD3422896.1 hypothetical protein [Candidatus Latescibacterota bacterium]
MKRILLIIALIAITAASAVSADSWQERVSLDGDFRHRFEGIDDGSKDTDRFRQRIRARLGLSGKVNDQWSIHLRLATGSSDPVSTNQTIGDGFSTKGFHLDRGYFKFKPSFLPGVTVMGGKTGNPFIRMDKTELIWDGDLNFEGASFKYTEDISDRVGFHLRGGGFCVEERKTDDDTRLFAGQTGITVSAADDVKVTFGGGYYSYTEAKGRPGFHESDEFSGNSTAQFFEVPGDSSTMYTGYANDFNIVEIFGELSFKIEKLSCKVFGNFVQNGDADDNNQGWLAGTTIKKGKGLGSVKLHANYRKLEKDAVLGLFTDSDTFGGGTDGKGLQLGLGVGIADNSSLAFTYYLDKKDLKEEIDYNRYQLDVKVSF